MTVNVQSRFFPSKDKILFYIFWLYSHVQPILVSNRKSANFIHIWNTFSDSIYLKTKLQTFFSFFFFRFILRRIIIRLANNFTDIPCNLFNSVSCNETRIHSCTHRFNIVSRCCVNCPFAIIFHIWFNWIFEMMKNEFVEGKLDNFTRLVISKMWTCEGNSRCIKYMVSAAFIFCILSHRDKRYHIIINCHREDLLKR